MTPEESERVTEIARLAYFALGAAMMGGDDREWRDHMIKLVDRVGAHCEALHVQEAATRFAEGSAAITANKAVQTTPDAAMDSIDAEVGIERERADNALTEIVRLSEEAGLYEAEEREALAQTYCDMCKGPCEVLKPERVERDLARLHEMLDLVLAVDPHATVHIGRGLKDHEFSFHVEVDDENHAIRLNRSRTLNQPGMWVGVVSRHDVG